MTALLVAEGLRKRYGEFVALDGVDLVLPAGRLTSVIGPNGAGKTTLINAVTGLVPADEGRVLLDGEDVTALPAHQRVRRGMGRSFQITSVFPDLGVRENVLLPILARRGESHRGLVGIARLGDALAEADHLLEAVGLAAPPSRPAAELSHGDQRLLEIAMALASRPRLCFLDEPCSGMNPAERRRVLELIERLSAEGEATFVVVEHDMDVVFSISEWIVVLDRGRVLAEGEPPLIRDDARVREIYLGEEVGQ